MMHYTLFISLCQWVNMCNLIICNKSQGQFNNKKRLGFWKLSP